MPPPSGGWALKHPHPYALLFGGCENDFAYAAEAIAEIHEGMLVLPRIIADLAGDRPRATRADKLDCQLLGPTRGRADSEGFSPPVLRQGVLLWTRTHSVVSLDSLPFPGRGPRRRRAARRRGQRVVG